jgi:hypothetical protein
VNAIVIRRGGAVVVVDVVVVDEVVDVDVDVAVVVDVEVVVDAVVTSAVADLSGADSPRRTADTSTVAHEATSKTPSSAATRRRMRPGSHAMVARRWIPGRVAPLLDAHARR